MKDTMVVIKGVGKPVNGIGVVAGLKLAREIIRKMADLNKHNFQVWQALTTVEGYITNTIEEIHDF